MVAKHFERIIGVDFEFGAGPSRCGRQEPRCVVAKDFLSGQTWRMWLDGVVAPACPFPVDDRTLYLGWLVSAELRCHLGLDWAIPRYVIDPMVEYRCLLNGQLPVVDSQQKQLLRSSSRFSLLAALYQCGFHVDAVNVEEKEEMRELALRGGPYSGEEQRKLLAYDEDDVIGLEKMFWHLEPHIDLGPALLRGRYMAAVASVERAGIPVDGPLIRRLKDNWDPIVDRLIHSRRDTMDVIKHRDVDQDKLIEWINRNGIKSWPRTLSGQLDTSSDTLSEMAKRSPPAMELKEFLQAVRRTRLFANLQIADDDRNRYLLGVFGSKTSRNQPSNAKSVFGPAAWVRSTMRPTPGHSLIYCDWGGQEYGEAAFFSGDERMIHDYVNDDPYLGFAKRIGLVPADATKKSHNVIRDQLKIAAGLGVLYGAQAETVARAGNMSEAQARRVLQEHRFTYPTFWNWRESVINHAKLYGELSTPFGWRWKVGDSDKATSISNFMMQASGADMMRLAVCDAVERGIEVVAPVHDALLVHCPTDAVEDVTQEVVDSMRMASNQVLGGDAVLKVGVESVVNYPDHYSDARGAKAWADIMKVLEEVEMGGWGDISRWAVGVTSDGRLSGN